MAVVFGGESPLEVYRRVREVTAEMRAGGREMRAVLPTEPLSTGRLSRAGRAVVNRAGPLRRRAGVVQGRGGRAVAASSPRCTARAAQPK